MEGSTSLDANKQCIVKICEGNSGSGLRRITDNVLLKAEANGTLASYYKCMNCYNAIMVNGRSAFKEHAAEWGRGLKRRRNYDETFFMSESIALLANIIYEREVEEKNPPVFAFSQLRSIAEIKDERLRLFFDEIKESACIRKKNKEARKELDRSLAYQC